MHKELLGQQAVVKELTEKLLDLCKKHGIQQAKVNGQVSFEKRMVVEQDAFALANSLSSQALSLTIIHEDKKASVSSNSLDPKGLEQMVINAKAMAGFSVADPFLTLATKEQAPRAKALEGLYDEAVAKVGMRDIRQFMELGMEGLRKESRLNLDRFEFTAKLVGHIFMNSNGVVQEERQSSLNWDYLGMARDGDDVSGMDFDSDFTYSLAGTEALLKKGTEEFGAKLVKQLGAGKAESYQGLVLLSPKAAADLVLDTIMFHASGRQVMDKKSKWEDAIGQQVAHACLNLIDKPHDLSLSGASAFDGDGLPTREQSLMKNGVLEQFFLDLYSAKKLKMKPNNMNGGPFALHVAAGDKTLNDLLNSQKTLLYVDRFSGNQNPLTGDFSGVAKGSRFYKNGKDMGPVTETMIAGNMLAGIKAIAGLCKDVERISGGLMMPAVLVDGLTVTGASV